MRAEDEILSSQLIGTCSLWSRIGSPQITEEEEVTRSADLCGAGLPGARDMVGKTSHPLWHEAPELAVLLYVSCMQELSSQQHLFIIHQKESQL